MISFVCPTAMALHNSFGSFQKKLQRCRPREALGANYEELELRAVQV